MSATGPVGPDGTPQDAVHGHVPPPADATAGPTPIPTSGSGAAAAKAPRIRKSTAVKLGVGAAVVGGAIALFALADDDDPEYAGVCVDQSTQTRIDDDYCNDGHHGGYSHVGWYFFAYGLTAPRVGAPVSGGSYTVPNSTYVQGGVPRQGGTVSQSSVKGGTKTTVRGGFGSSSKGGGS